MLACNFFIVVLDGVTSDWTGTGVKITFSPPLDTRGDSSSEWDIPLKSSSLHIRIQVVNATLS